MDPAHRAGFRRADGRPVFRSRLPSGEDIAVLRLYEPLGVALGYFGAKTYIPQWRPARRRWIRRQRAPTTHINCRGQNRGITEGRRDPQDGRHRFNAQT